MNRSARFPIAVLALAFVISWPLTLGAAESDSADREWTASWIGVQEATQPNQWLCFRKAFPLDSAPESAVARIAVDSKYWLWVNGELAVYEGQLKRGPNPRDTYYDEVDLAQYLTAGENTLAVLVWYFGQDGFNHKNSGAPGLLFELKAGARTLNSGATWKARVHPAFGQTGPPHPNYRMPDGNIHFDARRDIPGWQAPGYDDSAWPVAKPAGRPPAAPWDNLVKRPIPQWRNEGLRLYENDGELRGKSNGEPIRARLPRNLTISPYLKIRAPEGLTIDIRTDNYKGGSEYNFRSEYVTASGVQEFESLAYLNGHEVLYHIPPGVEVLALKYRETRYDTDFVGRFECDDPFFNTLWQKARNTMNVNMRDCIQDPDRERAQWWGDAVIVLGEMLHACDQRSHALIRKAIFNLVDWQKPDGVLYSPVPAGKWDRELPCQMLASVGEYGFWYYYFYTGDRETIEHAYPAVRKYLSLWQLDDKGLVVHRAGGWDWGDWGENKDRPVMDNAWYFMALSAAAKMADLTGNGDDAAAWRARMESIRGAFNKTFWDGAQYRSPAYEGATDDRGHGLAVVSGLAEPSQWEAIREVLGREFHASPYTEKYVLESLFLMNDPAGALARMKTRYRAMVESDVTTLWEGWGIGGEGYGGGSYNHGWAGGPLTLLSQYVAGVAPEEVAYRRYHVLPQLGPLKRVKARIPTVKGTIAVQLRDEGDSFSLELDSPQDTAAVVGIPCEEQLNAIRVNETLVWSAGRPMDATPGVTFIERTPQYIKFSVPPGKWRFVAGKKAPGGP